MVCITLLCVQPIPILSAFFLCHPYIPLSNLKNFSFTCSTCITQYGSTGYIGMVVMVYCTLGNCHFHIQLAVKWTHIYIIVTMSSKLRLVKNGLFLTMGKVSHSKNSFSEVFIFFWLNSRISLTGVHPHMKLGGGIDFGDTQGIGLLKFC